MTTEQDAPSGDVAIIGMAGRFPGAKTPDEFWNNLQNGVESIRQLSDEELLANGVSRRELEDPNYVKACPVLDDVDKFDASFFGFSPREASVMDPTHRFFLEVVWEALEHSGNTGLPEEGAVGVFAGAGGPLYLMNNVRKNPAVMAEVGEFLARHTGNDMNFLATRASYELDLRGPSLNIQTACSAALVSLHQARVSLLSGECDIAVAGGSTILIPHNGQGYVFNEGEILSPDGHCRPFDHRSAGTVFGSGTGAIVVKRLEDALDNGDTIHAVVKGSAINNDGSVKVGYLAPGVEGQVDAVKKALEVAKVPAESISYVETHGTGTSVGDPIELTALAEALSSLTDKKNFCGVGSVKSNIGHLGEAAGAASLIKAVMALKNKKLPPSLGYERPNPRFEFEDSPLYVVDKLKDWKPESDGPLRCGITALGAGGTNCHVILEEPPPFLEGEGEREEQLITISGKSRGAVDRVAARLADHLEANPEVDLSDVAYTLSVGRRAHEVRRVFSARNAEEAIKKLRSDDPKATATAMADMEDPGLVFTFPGGGAQYAGMGADLYESEEVYREAVDECLKTVDQVLDIDLRTLLFPSEETKLEATKKLKAPSLSLPALFTTEYALARLFESWGLTPTCMIGHSMGEYVAACLAGVFSVEDGIRLVSIRGKLFEEKVERGNMVAVSLSEQETRERMDPGLSIAAVNAPDLSVASGPAHLVEKLKKDLTAEEIDFTPIHIDVAAHSSMLDPILEPFREYCRKVDFQPPQRPMMSNLTGDWMTAEQATDPEYWVQHLRNTVRFADNVEKSLENGTNVYLEIGPGRTLTTLVAAQKTKVRHSINSIRHPKEEANDLSFALTTAGRVWAAGATLDWTAFYEHQLRNRIPLPSYPFEKNSYWVDPQESKSDSDSALHKRDDINEWFYSPSFAQTPLIATGEAAKSWLLICEDSKTAEETRSLLEKKGATNVIAAVRGPILKRISEKEWQVNPSQPAHFREMLEALDGEGALPEHTAYMLGLEQGEKPVVQSPWFKRLGRTAQSRAESPDEQGQGDYMGLVHLAKALTTICEGGQLSVVTSRALSVAEEALAPMRRLLLGPSLVVPREVPEFKTRFIDALPAASMKNDAPSSLPKVVKELLGQSEDAVVVLRGEKRFTRSYPQIALPPEETEIEELERNAVVAISGGLGGIGLVVAQHLASRAPVKLALLSRSGLPPREKWDDLLAAPDTSPRLLAQLKSVQQIEETGSQVLAVAADVTDLDSLKKADGQIRGHFGPVKVLIHAAGLLDDGPFQTKSDETIERVLAPKVSGALNLDKAMGQDLDLFVVFSSVASFLGLPGQIDYAAANAYLDAFAEDRNQRCQGRTIAINWNAWRDVGMVATEVAAGSNAELPAAACEHPLLGGKESTSNGHRVALDLSVDEHWLLSEHQIAGGSALVPGTGLVELVRGGALEELQAEAVELSDIAIMAPFQVAPRGTRRMSIEYTKQDDGLAATVLSLPERVEHFTANVRALTESRPQASDIAAIKARCSKQAEVKDGGYLKQDFVNFGPRWGNIQSSTYGEGEALLELSLSEKFSSDLPALAYHPAVMDMATGGAQHLLPGFDGDADFYVPFAYRSIRVHAPLTRNCYSHVRLDPSSQGEIAMFDITVMDESGNCLIDITGFTMKRAHKDAAIVSQAPQADAAEANAALEAILREAIRPEEGTVALDRIFGQTQLSQVVASSVDVNNWLAQLASDAARLGADEEEGEEAQFSRPDLATDYVAPQGALEEALVGMWSKLLGIEAPGVVDDFFALGGDSLTAVRFFARVKKKLGVSLPISALFQAPTVRTLAIKLKELGVELESEDADTGTPEKAFVPFRDLKSGSKAFVAAQSDELVAYKWEEAPFAPAAKNEGGRCWLVFLDDAGLGQKVRRRLSEGGDTVILVRDGDGYNKNSSTDYTVAPEKGKETYLRLLDDLKSSDGPFPTHILHMWLFTKDESFRPGSSFFHRVQERGSFSLFSLAQALADTQNDSALEIVCATNGLSSILREDRINDGKATVLGPLATFGAEFPRIRARHVDLALPTADSSLSHQLKNVLQDTTDSDEALENLADQLFDELLQQWTTTATAFRGSRRYRLAPEKIGFAPQSDASTKVGTYLLLGRATRAMVSLASALHAQATARFIWVHDKADGSDESVLGKQLRGLDLALSEEECDLANREHIRALVKRADSANVKIGGAVLSCGVPPRTLMQLARPGLFEEQLGNHVQAAQIVTGVLGDANSDAFVVLLGRSHSQAAADGEAAPRAGAAFLESHAALRAAEGQKTVALFESGTTEDSAALEQASSDLIKSLLGDGAPASSLSIGADAEQAPQALPAWGGESESAASPLNEELLDLWKSATGKDKVKTTDALVDLDATVLDAARLATYLKSRYSLGASVDELLSRQTIASSAMYIMENKNKADSGPEFRHLVPMHSGDGGDGTPFFLVAGMFGNILNLRHLGHMLGNQRPVYGVQARGLYGDEKPHATIEEMAEAYLEEIRAKQPHGPYALGGFSGGGLTALEMAKRLEAEGEEVSILVMLDTPLPQQTPITARDRMMVQKIRLQRQGVRYVTEWASNRMSWELQRIGNRFKRIDETYTPGEFNMDLIQQAFLGAAAAYNPGNYDGKLTLFRPALDKTYEVGPGRYLTADREVVLDDNGWSQCIKEVEVNEVPGDHDHMVLEPEVRVLAELLRDRLAQADSKSSDDDTSAPNLSASSGVSKSSKMNGSSTSTTLN